MRCSQRAVSRKRRCMPADSFVRIFKCVARRNFCGPRLREAATTLWASFGGQRGGTMQQDNEP